MTPTACAEAPSLAPATSQAPNSASEVPGGADVPAPAPSSTTTPIATSLPPSVDATAPTPAGERIPYTGLPTENPNSTVVPGKMRSDREEWPEPFTKEDADRAEVREYELQQQQQPSSARAIPAPGPDCQQYWPSDNWVCGAIRDKYNSLGAQFSFLLFPTSEELVNPDGFGRRQTFANGPIYWSASTGAHPVVNSFLNRWGQLGYELGWLGYPSTDEIVLPDGGRHQEFQNGAVYVAFQNAIGSAIRNGPIRDKWNSVGGNTPGGTLLGYVTGDEIVLPDNQGRMARFQNGVIYWSPNSGAHYVLSAILDKWASLGYESGVLGYPLSDELVNPDNIGRRQQFQNGFIYWSPTSGPHPITGQFLTRWAETGYEGGSLGYPWSDERDSPPELLAAGQRFMLFQRGALVLNTNTGVFTDLSRTGTGYLEN
ncbi:LGFP repeat-containing protein [Rhodococcus sp. SORGH_AS_0301]|uniref:LGFP repeat-containing protein n=1 Tax=Rhodococcus sp. SORGH_AS_0301 TaxID=3041780 RepID=UPI0027D8B94E|nr:hypothetical protein [Rhodococcus sp. SORGH_AS_0301]